MAHTYRDLPSAGTKLSIDLGYGYTEIEGLTDITWDGFQRGVRTPTKLTSTAKQKKPGMPDFGQIKGKLYYDPNDTTHQALRDRNLLTAAEYSAALDDFQLEYADGYDTPANAQVIGFVSTFSTSFTDPETGTETVDFTVEVTEITAFNDGSPAE